MKNITLTLGIVSLIFFTYTICARAESSTSSSVTNTTTSPSNSTNNNQNTTSQSTTYTTTSNATSASDDAIVSAIYDKFAKDSALTGTTLTVSSQNGIVTIAGNVTAQAQADEASILAKSVSGVKDVRSSINVSTNPSQDKSSKTPNY